MQLDLTHLDRLAHLLEVERREEHDRQRQSQAKLSAAEREALGLALGGVQAVQQSFGLGGRVILRLARPDQSPLETRLEPGTPVQIQRRASDAADAVRAVVSRRRRTELELALDDWPPDFCEQGVVWLEVMPNDITYQRCKNALQAVRQMEHGQLRTRRDVLWGAQAARFVSDLPPWTSRQTLNPEQLGAAQQALAARDFFLIHGPPGTGKSTVLAEVAVQAVARGERLLCTAASNAAVDHLLSLCLRHNLQAVRVGHPARVAESLQAYSLDVQVEQHPDRVLARSLQEEAYALLGYARRQRTQGRSAARFGNARAAQEEAKRLKQESRTLERRAVQSVLDAAQVICATCTSLAGSTLRERSFDRVLLDEATQATEPLTLLAFPKAPCLILAGDPCQLPPTVLSPQAADLQVSLFERLLEIHGPGVKALLREQYRMHQDIMTFAAAEAYDHQLRAHPSVAQHRLADLLRSEVQAEVLAPPILWIDTAGKGFDEERVSQGAHSAESLSNPGEASILVQRARVLLNAGLPAAELAVIAPYSAQVRLLRRALASWAPAAEVEVDTIDGFQGREKEAVLLSMTRSNATGELGFLNDLRRMNVAITRARRHLFVVGDSGTLGSHPYYERFFTYVQRLNGYHSAWAWDEPANLL